MEKCTVHLPGEIIAQTCTYNDVVRKSRAFVDIKSWIKIASNNDIRCELGKFSITITPRIPQLRELELADVRWAAFWRQNLTIAQRERDQTKSLTDAILRGQDTLEQMQLRVPRKKKEKYYARHRHLSRINTTASRGSYICHVLRRANDVVVFAHKYEVLPIAFRYIYAVFLSGAIICHANLTFRLDCRNTRQSAA